MACDQPGPSPDTITVEAVEHREVTATSASLFLSVESNSLYSGQEAFRRARELADLLAAAEAAGVGREQVILLGVRAETSALLGVRGSSVRYDMELRRVAVDVLPAAVGAVLGGKQVQLTRLAWHYDATEALLDELRPLAAATARRRAESLGAVLGVAILGVHQYDEAVVNPDRPESPPMYAAATTGRMPGDARARADLGLDFHQRAEASVTARIAFRVGPMSE